MNTQSSSMKKTLAAIAMLAAGLGMILAAWEITRPDLHQPTSRQPSAPEQDPTKRNREFFEKEIQPLVAAEDGRNRKAIQRAERRLDAVFQGYGTNVPKFAEALTSWGTKYEITKAMVYDWRSKTDEARKIPMRLFAETVVSDQKLNADITEIVAGIQSDFEASRDRMLSEATQRLKAADFPVLGMKTPDSHFLPSSTGSCGSRSRGEPGSPRR